MSLKLHDYDRQLKRCLINLENSKLSKKDKVLIIEFHNYCYSEGLSTPRVIHYVQQLKRLSELSSKDLEKNSRKDIETIVRVIEQSILSGWTKQSYRVTLKKFYRWLRKSDDDPEEVKWIKTTLKNTQNSLLPEELVTEEEVKKLIEVAENPRDKAFVSVLYESGCRVGELASVQLKHVTFDDYGAILLVDGKTGRRRVRVISSTPAIGTWLDNHPQKDDPEAPLWISLGTRGHHTLISYSAICSMLRRLARKANIKKKVNPHKFRHSRATHLATHLTEAQMKEHFGWTQGSNMASVYVHLSGRDVDNALLKAYGIKDDKKDKKESVLKPVNCKRCEELNSPTGKFCVKCGMPLNLETAIELDSKRKNWDKIMNTLVEDPDVQKVLAKKIVELGLKDQIYQA
ncbi:tyrosine-type recombinase/integrase [Thermoproteota archaeon]